MEIFEFKSYKDFLARYIQAHPRGTASQIAASLKIHNTTLSQVLHGSKNITPEQGMSLANYLNLNSAETDYLLMLINLERSGTEKLRSFYKNQISLKANQVKNQFNFKTTKTGYELSLEEKTRFYSSWVYSACRVLTSISDFQSLETISSKLNIPRVKTKEILDFLVDCRLCKKNDDRYLPGPSHTHISSNDFCIQQHRLNWRMKAIEKAGTIESHELLFSAPMSISKKDFLQVRAKLNEFIKQTIESALKSEPEVAVCLNVDLFEY